MRIPDAPTNLLEQYKMTDEEPLPGEDAQQFHDRIAAAYDPTPEQREYRKNLMAVKTRTAQDIVESMMEGHNMTREEAEEALIDSGFF
jgi:hypothetical protein